MRSSDGKISKGGGIDVAKRMNKIGGRNIIKMPTAVRVIPRYRQFLAFDGSSCFSAK